MEYDFSGWATRNDIKCSDGRTIRRDAFKDNDGKTVPLVWNHQHNDNFNVLGHAMLENRDDGVYAYCKFNDTESGRNAKLLVENGDITSLSIYANQLKQKGGNVLHGAIREVSLVLAGANPEAYIDTIVKHSDDDDEEAIIYTGLNDAELSLEHGSCGTKSTSESDTEKKKKNELEHAKEGDDMAEKTVQEVFDTLTEEQKTVVYALIGQALEDKNNEGDGNMKHNAFDNDDSVYTGGELSHDAINEIFSDAKRQGSLRESFLAHANDYGITNIDYLFPDAKAMSNAPDFIKRDTGWVQKFMASLHHSPFSRIKSIFADITEDEARAKGYIKGNMKKNEVFTLLKRTTTPTTIYKKQKLDRDDVVDITDFDVVAWIKTEMRMMLDEEIARAVLVGDGRLSSSDEKINETNIRPIWTDDDLYTIKSLLTLSASTTDDEKAKAFIKSIVKARKDYKGSGNPTLYTTEDMLTNCLLLEDSMGHRLYKNESEVAQAMRVKEIVTVPVMENLTRSVESKTRTLEGIVVNPIDYNVGADKGGAINMFDDFDIDYNQQKYLIETRCSGALTKPYSAIAIESVTA